MPKDVFYTIPEDRQLKLLKPALKEFVTNPYEKINVTSLTSTMKILRTDFYYYFLDKDDIYDKIIDDYVDFINKEYSNPSFVDLKTITFNKIASITSVRQRAYLTDLTESFEPKAIKHFVETLSKRFDLKDNRIIMSIKLTEFAIAVNAFLKSELTKDEVLELISK